MPEKNSTILACIDGSALSSAVADYGAWISATIEKPLLLLNTVEHHKNGAKTNLTGNIGLGTRDELLETLSSEDQKESRALMSRGKEALQAAKDRALKLGVTPQVQQQHGELYENLVEMEGQIRVLLIGQRGEDSRGELKIGQQVQEVIRSLHKPVLLVNQDYTRPQKVMLAYDGSHGSEKALEMVAQSPLFKTLPCHVVNVNKNKDAARKLLDRAKEQLEGSGVEAIYAAMEGEPVSALMSYQSANGIDLLVMGAFSHNRLRDAIFGSFTAKVMARSPKPLLLLR
jgi:nucleotide-binding universal stress UspA family protein